MIQTKTLGIFWELISFGLVTTRIMSSTLVASAGILFLSFFAFGTWSLLAGMVIGFIIASFVFLALVVFLLQKDAPSFVPAHNIDLSPVSIHNVVNVDLSSVSVKERAEMKSDLDSPQSVESCEWFNYILSVVILYVLFHSN